MTAQRGDRRIGSLAPASEPGPSMIEPSLVGSDLLRAMEAQRPDAPGTVSLWPLGQSGMCLIFHSAIVYIDLYLSNHCEAVLPTPYDHRRLTRAPLDPSEITNAQVVICSHDHLDHLDPPTIRTIGRSSPSAVIALPESASSAAIDLGWEEHRVLQTRHDQEFQVDQLVIVPFGVPHDNYDEDPVSGHPYQGFIISDGEVSVAHVGDARVDDQLIHFLSSKKIDAICLPINGRDEKRAALGFAGNMNSEEAVNLAASIKCPIVVPMHFDMFEQNIDADAFPRFVDAIHSTPEITMSWCAVGESIQIRGNRDET